MRRIKFGGQKQKLMTTKKFETEWGGRKLSIEIGGLAGQANGSCLVQYGDTTVLAAATMSENIREGIDFFPLLVDYEEKLYAAGKIKGCRFIKREGRPSDEAILTGRFIDRAIRPLFNSAIRNDVQIIISALSWDGENDPDIPAMLAAAVCLMISDIPWNGPIAGIRVGQIEGEWMANPTYNSRQKSILDIVMAVTADEKIIMLEAGANEVSEEIISAAIQFGQKHLRRILTLIQEVREQCGKQKKQFSSPLTPEELNDLEKNKQEVVRFLEKKLPDTLFSAKQETKQARLAIIKNLRSEIEQKLKEQNVGKERRQTVLGFFQEYIETAVSKMILEKKIRVDGRSLTAIRPLDSVVGLLPRTHGSAIFSRGDTQALATVTLGAPSNEQTLDSMELSGKKRYFHHYNFPPYSVGEVSNLRGAGRREIGHGGLVERAILPVLPSKETFPYTIRTVSEILSSNGSSSMASVCGTSLALMDAGVPIRTTVAGIAMGLASDTNGNYQIITDLQDMEDTKGGMDFKIAGTKNGITAVQMDTKTSGLTPEIIQATLQQGLQARLEIISKMEAVLGQPRPALSPYAPRVLCLTINPERIRDVIGPGGKIIHEIIEKTGVTIDIENSGLVTICSTSEESMNKAVEWVKNLTREVKVGEIFQGRVTRILDFGAFAEILPNQEGLVHISELAPYRVGRVEDIVKVGDIIPVKVVKIDEQGRINLSLKQAQQLESTAPVSAPPAPPERRFRPRPRRSRF